MKNILFLIILFGIFIDLSSQTTINADHFISGRDVLPSNGESITDTFLFYDQHKGAFRGGYINNTNFWSPDSLGFASFAYGSDVIASGKNSVALGLNTIASGYKGAIAMGEGTIASGDYGATAMGEETTASGFSGATAMGYNSIASGNYGSTAMGRNTTASGSGGATALGVSTIASGSDGATAFGSNTEASGEYGATAMGENTIASGNEGATAMGVYSIASGADGATALGYETTASGDRGATALGNNTSASGDVGATALGDGTIASGEDGATALGTRTIASGFNGATALGYKTLASGSFGNTALGHITSATGSFGATAIGNSTIATGNSCTVVGMYNDSIVATATPITSSSPIFIVGNGDDTLQSNALVINKNGKIGIGVNAPLAAINHFNGAKLTLSGIWTDASDVSKKYNIEPLVHGLKTILALDPVSYNYLSDDSHSLGFVAQELEKVLPEMVYGEDGDKSIGYGQITAVLTKAVQEQQEIITRQESVIREHELALNNQQTKIEAIILNEEQSKQIFLERIYNLEKIIKNTIE